MQRQLITRESWGFRYQIATMGYIPAFDDAAFYGLPHFNFGASLPERGAHGYDVAYLEVDAPDNDPDALARGEWDNAGNVLCAECAERDALESGEFPAYLPMQESNGEIHNGHAAVYCDNCASIVQDSYVVTLVESTPDGTDTREFLLSEMEEAREHAAALADWHTEHDTESYAVAVINLQDFWYAREIAGGKESASVAYSRSRGVNVTTILRELESAAH